MTLAAPARTGRPLAPIWLAHTVGANRVDRTP